MPDAAGTITTKVKAFAKDITAYLTAERLKKEKALKKAGKDADATLVKVSFEYSSSAGSVSRTPEKQAEYVSKGTSWTCAGSHLVDKARHVKMLYGAAGSKPGVSWDLKGAFGAKDHHFMTLSTLQTKWAALMKKHDLKNHKGGDGWGKGDAFHFELDDSKVPRSDKRVQACLLHYAKLTRLEGKPKNTKFENGSWKSDLKPVLAKIQAEADKRAQEAKREEMKKLRIGAEIKGTAKLLQGANKSSHASNTSWASMVAPVHEDRGKETVRKVSGGSALVWDSLGRSLFEKLGMAETKGFDVQVKASVAFELVQYANLSQSFIRNLVPTASVVYNTPVARWLSMSVTGTSRIILKANGADPAGTVVFDVVFKSPLASEKRKILIDITGSKVKATSQ
ncbi:MAG: hypothetical protein AAF214_02125 [Pseudomonadota bacterium]